MNLKKRLKLKKTKNLMKRKNLKPRQKSMKTMNLKKRKNLGRERT